MVDIDCDDRMSVNVAATAEYKAKRKAEDARRATVANRNGFNGTERNGYAVTTLAEGIS
jgi:hypothetical protein